MREQTIAYPSAKHDTRLEQKEKRKRRRRKLFRENYELYLLLIPALIHLFVFSYIPLYGIVIAFQEYTPGMPFFSLDGSVKWVGLKHFKDFLTSPMAPRLFFNTFWLSFLNRLSLFSSRFFLRCWLMNWGTIRSRNSCRPPATCPISSPPLLS